MRMRIQEEEGERLEAACAQGSSPGPYDFRGHFCPRLIRLCIAIKSISNLSITALGRLAMSRGLKYG